MTAPPATLYPLRKARLDRQLSLMDVAQGVGIDTGNLSRIERGMVRASPEVAERLVAFFGSVALDELQVLYPERYPIEEQPAVEPAP